MKRHIESLLQMALKQLQESGDMPAMPAYIQVQATRDKSHGDYAANIAMVLAKLVHEDPLDIANRILHILPSSPYLQKVEVAGPGFINFFLTPQALNEVVATILAEKECYGRCKIGRGKRILVEFLSATPIGLLHVNHGRQATFGTVMANLLNAVGFKPYREYYINDAGRQMDKLVISIWLQYLQLCGETMRLPMLGYASDQVNGIARRLYALHRQQLQISAAEIFAELTVSEDQDAYLAGLVARAKKLLGDQYETIASLCVENMLAERRGELAEFGIHFDNWFSERQFIVTGVAAKAVEKLREHNHVYEKEHTLWFRATQFGDSKDRLLINAQGLPTYFLNDVAYHINKFERGFDIAINIVDSNHHGYPAGIKAAMEAVGINPERLIYVLVESVALHSKNDVKRVTTQNGKLIAWHKLREAIGDDAVRLFYVMRKAEQRLDIDLAFATVPTNKNPIYSMQYAYARIGWIMKQLAEAQVVFNEANGLAHSQLLLTPQERQILNTLSRYPDIIVDAALRYEPHLLVNFLRELAADFYVYDNSHPLCADNEDNDLRDARLALIVAVRQTLLNGFNLLGISVPESM